MIQKKAQILNYQNSHGATKCSIIIFDDQNIALEFYQAVFYKAFNLTKEKAAQYALKLKIEKKLSIDNLDSDDARIKIIKMLDLTDLLKLNFCYQITSKE